MTTETILLRPEEGDDVTLTTYISGEYSDNPLPPSPAVLVLPGGAYALCSNREAEPIVKPFFAAGFNCFVLRYSLGEKAVAPRPLVDASRAMVHIRENAEKYHIDPDRVFVVGFSAGGHLAASLGTLWHEDFAKAYPDMPYGANRPTGMILGYPVITSGPYAHRKSFYNLLGTTEPTEEQMHAYSLEHHVDERTVPTYIWHTGEDQWVPVQNSLLFMSALAEAKVPFEAHIFPEGPHGLALAGPMTNKGEPCPQAEASQWVDEAIDWISRVTRD